VSSLLVERSLPRFAAARALSGLRGSGQAAQLGPLRLAESATPELPGPDWALVRPLLAGICGSDLATVDGRSSRYFEELVSFPFVPGHEVVGVLERAPGSAGTDGELAPGTRVVVEPVLGCLPRGIQPPCPACAGQDVGGCQRVAFGHLAPGLQIGYCRDTGGGWSSAGLVAHASQVHRVPDDLDDESAVMVEPTACAVHAVAQAPLSGGELVAVLGAGTLGLLVVAALRHLADPGTVVVGARYPHQRRWARELGGDLVVPDSQLPRSVRRATGSLAAAGALSAGADVVFDCVGSADSIRQALGMTRPRGTVILVGMPEPTRLDLAPLWHRQVRLQGAYAYGRDLVRGQPRRTFEVALELAARCRLGRLVSASYPLERFEAALAHAGQAGRRGAVKVVFDLRTRRQPSSSSRPSPAPGASR
jgi:threonine dehydrogenase-like Zn-dependent dehydrogenase